MTLSEMWSTGYLVDKILDDLMEIEINSDLKFNKYILQILDKLRFFLIKSPKVHFDISFKDLGQDTLKLIKDYTKDCKTQEEKYAKLDGPMTEVIARITMQAKPLVLSSVREKEITTLLEASINQIRELVSFKWRFIY
jgi:hypothetical protein